MHRCPRLTAQPRGCPPWDGLSWPSPPPLRRDPPPAARVNVLRNLAGVQNSNPPRPPAARVPPQNLHTQNTTHKHVLLARNGCPPPISSVPSSLRVVRVPERRDGLAQTAFAPAPGHRDAPQAAQRLARARVQPPNHLAGCPRTTLNRKNVQDVRHTPNNDDRPRTEH